jgi:hypothetical protein
MCIEYTRMIKTVIKLKKPLVPVPVPVAVPVPAPMQVAAPMPVLEQKKTIIKLKKKVPPPPAPGVYITKAMEAFEAIREYCLLNKKPISDQDIRWYQDELLREKKEMDDFWAYCEETRVNMECFMRGDDDWKTALALNAARQKVKALPVKEDDIGPMPEYGSEDFWAWCHKRKKLKEQKDAAIVAAGGTVKEKKPKQVKPKQVKPQATSPR